MKINKDIIIGAVACALILTFIVSSSYTVWSSSIAISLKISLQCVIAFGLLMIIKTFWIDA